MEKGERRQCGQAKCQQAAGRCSCPELQRPATAAPCRVLLQGATAGPYYRITLQLGPCTVVLHCYMALMLYFKTVASWCSCSEMQYSCCSEIQYSCCSRVVM